MRLKLQLPIIPHGAAQHSSLIRSQPQEVWPSALCVNTTSNTIHVLRERNLPHKELFYSNLKINRLFIEMSIHVEVNRALCDQAICHRSHSALQTQTSTSCISVLKLVKRCLKQRDSCSATYETIHSASGCTC